MAGPIPLAAGKRTPPPPKPQTLARDEDAPGLTIGYRPTPADVTPFKKP